VVLLDSKPGAEAGPKVQRFSMLAHTGTPVDRGFFGSMVFDLAGIESGAKVPILMNHDENQIVGFADSSKITEEGLRLEGVILTEEEAGAKVQRLSKSGFPFQASIGVSLSKTEDLAAGETEEINGREVMGPATIVRKSRLLESSFLPAGADGNTSATALSAKRDPMEAIEAARQEAEKKGRDAARAECSEFMSAFPGRESWAALQFAAQKTLTEAKAELSDVLLAELAAAREQLAAVPTAVAAAPTAVAADPAAQVALTATHPGVGFSGAARQEPGTPTKQDLSGLSLSERALAEWNGTGKESLALQREFFGQFRFYLAFLQQEAKKNGEVV